MMGHKKYFNGKKKMENYSKIIPATPSYLEHCKTWCFCFQSSSHAKTRLSGYGVELAIKSTEYKAKDDTKVEGNQSPR